MHRLRHEATFAQRKCELIYLRRHPKRFDMTRAVQGRLKDANTGLRNRTRHRAPPGPTCIKDITKDNATVYGSPAHTTSI